MTDDEKELRYWLANEDWYQSRHTRDWLARTPPADAADTLALIAADAEPESRSPFAVLASVAAVAGFSPSNAIAGGNPNARKAGVRAALMLADAGDVRAIAPLVRVYETSTNWQSKYQEQIESALTCLLPLLSEAEVGANASEIRTLAPRIWDSARQDLSPARTALLLAIVEKFDTTQSENRALLEGFSQAQDVRKPNRAQVAHAAQSRLGVTITSEGRHHD